MKGGGPGGESTTLEDTSDYASAPIDTGTIGTQAKQFF